MTTIARLQPSNVGNPLLDVFFRASGVPSDVFILEFRVFELVTTPGVETQVFPVSGREVVDLIADRVSVGRYAADWTPGVTEPIGAHRIRWYFKLLSTSSEQTYAEDFTVSAAVGTASASASSSSGYTTIQGLRDEGVTVTMASDDRLEVLIRRASAMVDHWTGRTFTPTAKTVLIDGRGSRGLLLDEAIVAITAVRILDSFSVEVSPTDVLLDAVRVYNRHITQGLLDPDDRENPRIEFVFPPSGTSSRIFGGAGHWPIGRQNIEVVGVFGYTDVDGVSPPPLIVHATNLMVVREIARLADTDSRDDVRDRFRVTKQKTRDQEIGWSAGAGGGAFSGAGLGRMTGDAEIDVILERYVRPTKLGAA